MTGRSSILLLLSFQVADARPRNWRHCHPLDTKLAPLFILIRTWSKKQNQDQEQLPRPLLYHIYHVVAIPWNGRIQAILESALNKLGETNHIKEISITDSQVI